MSLCKKVLFLAVDEVNARGGISGHQIEILIRDSQSTVEGGVAAFEELESDYMPLLYLSTRSEIDIVLGEMAEENEVVFLSIATTAGITEGKDWMFQFPALTGGVFDCHA